MRTLVVFSMSVVIIAVAISGCSDGAKDSSSSKPAAKPGSQSHTAAAGRHRVTGAMAQAAPSNVASCLADAGFTAAPPSHGVSQQWSAEDGSIVALSSDPGQAASTASEVGGKVVGSSGYVVAGSGALASAAKTCVQRADA